MCTFARELRAKLGGASAFGTSNLTKQTMNDSFAIQLFEGKKVRIVWDAEKEKYYFAVADIVQVLTDSEDVKQYIKRMRARDPELNSRWGTICTPTRMMAADGKVYKTQAADIEGIFRIIQSIPSKKAEPVKKWLAAHRPDDRPGTELPDGRGGLPPSGLQRPLDQRAHALHRDAQGTDRRVLHAGRRLQQQQHSRHPDVRTSSRPFTGTFDGNAKTLTVDINSNEEGAAPFHYIDGASIESLYVYGTVTSSANYAAGLVASTNPLPVRTRQRPSRHQLPVRSII